MITGKTLNPGLLRMVADELLDTLKLATEAFSRYVGDDAGRSDLELATEQLHQLRGTFELLEIDCAATLCQAIAQGLIRLSEQRLSTSPFALIDALSQALFILPRYFEHLCEEGQTAPLALQPDINRLHGLLGKPFQWTHELLHCDALPVEPLEQTLNLETDAQDRLAHFYRAAWLGCYRDGNSRRHLRALHYVCGRLVKEQAAATGLWRQLQALLDSVAEGALRLDLTRLKVLSCGDRSLRHHGQAVLPEDILRELQSLVDEGEIRQSALFADQVRSKILGPGQDTFDAVLQVLREELRTAKDIMEIASQHHAFMPGEREQLCELLQRLASALGLLSQPQAAEVLHRLIQGLGGSDENHLENSLLQNAADALLYVENGVASLLRHTISDRQLEQVRNLTQQELVAYRALTEAKELSVRESLTAIALAKRAITSYSESGYDRGHISNLITTLTSVRGAMRMLDLDRATAVLQGCIRFVDDQLKRPAGEAQAETLLETLADALISLEYYLDGVLYQAADADVLRVAEESLASLGYRCDAA